MTVIESWKLNISGRESLIAKMTIHMILNNYYSSVMRFRIVSPAALVR